MHASAWRQFHSEDSDLLVAVLGTNEIASAVAARLRQSQFGVLLSHDGFPPVIRRAMSFHDALFGDAAVLEGVEGRRADTNLEISSVLADPKCVAVTPMHFTDLLAIRSIHIVIDARMQKHHVTPDLRGVVPMTVGLGPYFSVGVNCDIAIETHPSANGVILRSGSTRAADRQSQQLGSVGRERFVYAERAGVWHTPVDIGTRVFKGFVLGQLGGQFITSPIDGVLRGIARDGTRIPEGVKLVELDPRGRHAEWTGMDERGRAIADATLHAVHLCLMERRATTQTLFSFSS